MVSVRVIRMMAMIVMIEVEVLQTKSAVHSFLLLRRPKRKFKENLAISFFFIFKTNIKKHRKFGAKPDDVKFGAKRTLFRKMKCGKNTWF